MPVTAAATLGRGAFPEKSPRRNLTLALARELRDDLVKRGRVRVAMTRDDDRYLTLDDRAAVARRLDAAMFVSLHIDSAPNPLARGASVYSLSDVASDAEAAHLAASENGAGMPGVKGGPVEAMLSDLVMRSQMSASADLASRLVNKSAGRFDLRPEPHRFAAFYVLRSAGTPAVLFEAGYLSNTDDEVLLRDPSTASDIVLALAQAIEADVAPLPSLRDFRPPFERLDAAPNEIRASQRPRFAAPRSRRLQQQGARVGRSVVGTPLGALHWLVRRRPLCPFRCGLDLFCNWITVVGNTACL